MFGQYIYSRATPFIFALPGCVSCNTFNTLFLKVFGITIFPLHIIHSSITSNSCLLFDQILNVGSLTTFGHPFLINCLIIFNSLSFSVSLFTCSAFTGTSSNIMFNTYLTDSSTNNEFSSQQSSLLQFSLSATNAITLSSTSLFSLINLDNVSAIPI
ncbi:unnamed protein product [Meloidogyne enterolobii]|uniref:Uncharacterized protein n=1 Tax=Meloidogyne enterolobii TaxID=390850 RepID=A0ACB0YPS7_MELEN